VATPAFSPYVWLTTIVLITLYSAAHGTAGIGRFFGPVMVIWFVALAAWAEHRQAPAIWPPSTRRMRWLLENGCIAFRRWAPVLALTGAEALYADMGHFGKKPIRVAWFLIVFPALALNYWARAPAAGASDAIPIRSSSSWAPGAYPLVVLSTWRR
jgi:KUP system potassium uptake protein